MVTQMVSLSLLGVLLTVVVQSNGLPLNGLFDDALGKLAQGNVTEKFERFMKNFKMDKKWNKAERTKREGVFKRNLERIDKLNVEAKQSKRHGSAVFGVNKFSHLTFDEFKQQMLMSDDFVKQHYGKANTTTQDSSSRRKRQSSPTSFDWRSQNVIGPIKDQASCGCCWAFATTAAAEAQIAIKGGGLVDLAEQELVNCETQSSGCSGGYIFSALDYIRDKGLHYETALPYQTAQQSCPSSINGAVRKVDAVDDLTLMTEDQRKDYLVANGPFAISFGVVDSFQHYVSGVYYEDPTLCNTINHAMLAVGYGVDSSNVPYWIIKNQWGTDWGDQGYIKVRRNANTCCIGHCGYSYETMAPRINTAQSTLAPGVSTTTAPSTTTTPGNYCVTREPLIALQSGNTTYLTTILQSLYGQWAQATRTGFDPYFNQIRSVIWGSAYPSSSAKINAIVTILASYKASSAPKETLFNLYIQLQGYPQISIQQFVDCGQIAITTAAPTTTKATTTAAPAATTPAPYCSARAPLIEMWWDNTTYFTDILDSLSSGWQPATRAGFNSYYNQIKSVIWGSTYPTSSAKINAIVTILNNYRNNNGVPHELLFDLYVQIEDYPAISFGQFVDCGYLTSSTSAPKKAKSNADGEKKKPFQIVNP